MRKPSLERCVPWQTFYKSTVLDDVETNFFKLLEKHRKLTLDTSNVDALSKRTVNVVITPFEEIRLIPPSTFIAEKHAYLMDPVSTTDMTYDYATQTLITLIRDAILEYWNSNVPHVILHSGGNDSRIISATLAKLRESEGKDWLGEIHFLCFKPEEGSFLKIMTEEKWTKNQYSVYRPEASHVDYYRFMGDFKSAYLSNGFCSYWVSGWFKSIEEGIFNATGYLPHQVVIVAGFGGSEFLQMSLPLHSLRDFYRRYYNVDHFYRATKGLLYDQFLDFYAPLTDYNVVAFILKVPRTLLSANLSNLSSKIIPQLSRIPRTSGANSPCWTLSDDRIKTIKDSYQSSLFYRDVPMFREAEPWIFGPRTIMTTDQKIYSLASMYDKLIEQGTEIEVSPSS